jgi:hypothetical protein
MTSSAPWPRYRVSSENASPRLSLRGRRLGRMAVGNPDLLRTGIYTVRDAADLIGVSAQKIRAWIAGWPRTVVAPVVENDLGWVDDRLAFSFANLMELRFIAFFEGAGVKLREIRTIMDEVRAELHRPHPFATNVVCAGRCGRVRRRSPRAPARPARYSLGLLNRAGALT